MITKAQNDLQHYGMDSIISSTIIVRKLQGYSAAAITREIQKTHTNITYKTVLNFIRAHKQQRAGISQPFRGRKFVASEVEEIKSFISNIYATNNEVTSTTLMKMIKETLGYDVKRTMLKKFRKQLGFVCKSTKSGHLIRSVNQEKRLEFCTHMLDIKVCITVENTNIIEEERFRSLSPTVCSRTKAQYNWILIPESVLFKRTTIPNIQASIQGIDLLNWASDALTGLPESPDLNPIEKVWHQLKHYLRTEYKPVSKDTLIAGIRQFWKTRMTVDQCCRYIGHIHKVMKIVRDVNGEHSGE
uniref:DDE_3 domain-containing protein n=1 Tax=Heterorhabditis bacteriophora TaxID=37862 RepID=A0A1I7WE97_HETBA